ncbi:MAG: hypothetical protein K6E21_00640 [Bacilli bacterium]|nr:hypothetical protein [Bacilli bacterium]
MNKKVALCLLSLCFCACACTATDNCEEIENNQQEDNKDYLKYYENDKYIVGKRIFDSGLYPDTLDGEFDLAIPEVTEAVCTYRNGIVDIKKDGVLKNRGRSLYIADVNQDGYFDLCFKSGSILGDLLSSRNKDSVCVYDAHNSKYLDILDCFEGYKNDNKSYYFDLDKNNVLYLIEGSNNQSVFKLGKIERTARLLKDQEKKFEWFDLDYKFTSFLYGVDRGDHFQGISQPEIMFSIYGFFKPDIEFPLTANDFTVEKVKGSDFDVYIERSKFYKEPGYEGDFRAFITFKEAGDYTIRVKAGNLPELNNDNKFDLEVYEDNLTLNTWLYSYYEEYYDLEKNAIEISRGWPKIYFALQDYVMAQSEDYLSNYFGINNGDNIVIKSKQGYETFKDKLSELENNNLICDKNNSPFPVVDFDCYKIVVTALYKPDYAVNSELNYVRQIGNYLTIEMNGTYSDDYYIENSCYVCLAYLLVSKDINYTVSGKMTFKNDGIINNNEHGEL